MNQLYRVEAQHTKKNPKTKKNEESYTLKFEGYRCKIEITEDHIPPAFRLENGGQWKVLLISPDQYATLETYIHNLHLNPTEIVPPAPEEDDDEDEEEEE